MAEEVGAVVLRVGPVQVVLGDDEALSGVEFTAAGEADRLGVHEVEAFPPGGAVPDEVTVRISADRDAEQWGDTVSVEELGQPSPGLLKFVESLDEPTRQRAVAESALGSWRARVAGIADALEPITAEDSTTVGPIEVVGRPLLSDLLARVRVVARSTDTTLDLDIDAIGAVVDELDASVGFALAGLEAAGDEFNTRLLEGTEPGGWHQKLRLLLAAEEVYASAYLLKVRRGDTSSSDREGVRWVVDRRRSAATIAEHLAGIADRVQEQGTKRWRPTGKRKRDSISAVVHAGDVYSVNFLLPTAADDFESEWAETVAELNRADNAIAVFSASDNEDIGRNQLDATARMLGEIFSRQLPNAREMVADIERSHPGFTGPDKIRYIKRQLTTRIQVGLTNGDDVLEDVALLAMSLAVLRGITPSAKKDFADIGRRLLDNSGRIAGIHAKTGAAETAVSAAFEMYFHKVQPTLIEAIFRAMEVVRPGQAGPARDVYKAMRKNVWGARHNRNIGRAAGAGAARGIRTVANAGAPWLIVRTVDRAIK